MGGTGTGGGIERARILIVEEELSRARRLAGLLAGRFQVGVASDEAAAVEAATQHPPDVILLELGAGEDRGLGLLERLVTARETGESPVLVWASEADEQLVVRCLERGAADVLAPPRSQAELVARLERAVRQGRTERALKRLAQTDALTGLGNYGALQSHLQDEVARARRYGQPLSIVAIDLDALKAINDRFGHEVGNRAIVALARHLKSNLRETDFAARFGGDEFVVLLPFQAEQAALVFVERLRAGLDRLEVEGLDGSRLGRITLSAGVAEFRAGTDDPRTLMDAADAALYEAKRRGRDCAVAYGSLEGRVPLRSRMH